MATTIDVKTFYNSKAGALKIGYYNKLPFIDISSVYEDYYGKDPVKGAKMYDYDNSIFFSITPSDIIKIEKGIELIKKNDDYHFSIIHGNKQLVIGKDLDDDSYFLDLILFQDNKEIENEVTYTFNKDVDEGNALRIYNYAKEESTQVELDCELEEFLMFIRSSKDVYFKLPEPFIIGESKTSSNSSNNSSKRTTSKRRRRRIIPKGNKEKSNDQVLVKNAKDIFKNNEEDIPE